MDLTKHPKYKIRKVIKSSAAHGHYAYQIRCVEFVTRVDDYLDLQVWAWENFGPSLDYEFLYYEDVSDSKHYNSSWCYQSDLKARKYCIYMNQDAMTMFLLKWID